MEFDVGIIGGSNPGRYPKMSSEATYNMFQSDKYLVPYAGYESIHDFITGQGRAFFKSDLGGFALSIIGASVYRIESFYPFVYYTVGSIGTSSGFCSISENGNRQISVCDGTSYYVYDYNPVTPTFNLISLDISPQSVNEALGYIFISANNSNTFIYTSENDALTFPVTNTGSLGSDRIVGMAGWRDRIYVFGQRSLKSWRSLGTALNPFQLDQSSSVDYGCLSEASISSACDIIAWLGVVKGGTPSIMAIDKGSSPVIISTDGIDYKISQLSHPSDCSGFIWKQDGHVFYQLTFFNDNFTLLFDFTTKQFYYLTDENLNMHIAKELINFNNDYYFLSFTDAKVYQISSNFEDYDGAIIPRIRITPPVRYKNYNLVRYKMLEVVAEQGVSSQPMNMDVSFSTDGAISFNMPQRVPFSNQGNYNYTARVFQLGSARDITFQFRFYGVGRFVIIGSNLVSHDEDLQPSR